MNTVAPAFLVSLVFSLALYKSHYLRSRVVGFESAGVVLVDVKSRMPIVFVGAGNKLSFPTGKVEFSDFVGITPYGIAKYTAARELQEETGIDIDLGSLVNVQYTGAGKTDTGAPVVWFCALVDFDTIKFRPGEFSRCVLLQEVLGTLKGHVGKIGEKETLLFRKFISLSMDACAAAAHFTLS